MKLRDKFFFVKKDLIANKNNIIIILLLIIITVISTVGIAYYIGIQDFWNDWMEKSYDFRLYLVSYDDNISDETMKQNLQKNEHVQDVFTYPELLMSAVSLDLRNDKLNGEISIWGTVANTKKIIAGSDISNSNYEMICPQSIYPGPVTQEKQYNKDLEIDISSYLGKYLNFELFSGTDETVIVKMKLVGLYDANYDYSDSNFCYTNHATIADINRRYQEEVYENMSSGSFYVLLDDNKNLDSLKNQEGIIEILPFRTIKKEVGDNVIAVTGILLIISYLLSIIIISLIYIRRIKRNYTNYSIYLAYGYNRKDLKSMTKIECCILILVSILLSIFAIEIIISNFSNIFLMHDMQLSKIDISIPWLIVIANIFIMWIVMSLSIKASMNKIDELEVIEVMRNIE